MVGQLVARRRFGLAIPIGVLAALVTANISAGACSVSTAISLNPTSGAPGTTIMVSGGGFAAGQEVDISIGANGPVVAQTTGPNFAKVPVTVPQTTGPIALAATDHSGDIAYVTATFDVTPPATTAGGTGSFGNSGSGPAGATGTGSTGSNTTGAVASGSTGANVVGTGPFGSVAAPMNGSATAGPDGTVSAGPSAPLSLTNPASQVSGASVSSQPLSGLGAVYGGPANGFSANSSAFLGGGAARPLQGTAPAPGAIVLAALLPLLFVAGGGVALRRRKGLRIS